MHCQHCGKWDTRLESPSEKLRLYTIIIRAWQREKTRKGSVSPTISMLSLGRDLFGFSTEEATKICNKYRGTFNG